MIATNGQIRFFALTRYLDGGWYVVQSIFIFPNFVHKYITLVKVQWKYNILSFQLYSGVFKEVFKDL